MLNLLLFALIPIGTAAGLVGGHFLAPKSEVVELEVPRSDKEPAKETLSKVAKREPPSLGETDYVKLDKQFVVPVVEGEKVTSLVVMTLAIEVKKDTRDLVFEYEPKLRAEFLAALFNHAQSGAFSGVFIKTQLMEDLRASLNSAAWSVLGDIAQEVLVTSMVRQDA